MKFLLFGALSLLLFSCDNNVNRDDLLPNASGKHGEIFILTENQIWDGEIGEMVRTRLAKKAKGPYLRPEPTYYFSHTTPKNLNHINQLRRNMLRIMIDRDSAYTETKVELKPNYFAKNQLLVILKDSDEERLYNYVKNNFDEIVDIFEANEIKQLGQIYRSEANRNIKARTEEMYGISIALPKKMEFKYEKDGFMLIKRDRSSSFMANESTNADGGTFWIQQGFMFWAEPYKDESQLTVQGVLNNRDSVLKANIPGRLSGTYMGTEYDEYYKPESKVFRYNGHYTIEVRGLWKYKGESFIGGGGPFVQYTILNETRNLVITVCGYVYAPKFNKRDYIREIDAILNTIELVN